MLAWVTARAFSNVFCIRIVWWLLGWRHSGWRGVLFISLFAGLFWGSGLGWREPKKDRRNGL